MTGRPVVSAPTDETAREQLTCPNCGAPWMEGTGLFRCGEGIRGMVHGGCRVYYTARYIRELRDAARREARDDTDRPSVGAGT